MRALTDSDWKRFEQDPHFSRDKVALANQAGLDLLNVLTKKFESSLTNVPPKTIDEYTYLLVQLRKAVEA